MVSEKPDTKKKVVLTDSVESQETRHIDPSPFEMKPMDGGISPPPHTQSRGPVLCALVLGKIPGLGEMKLL